MIFSAKKGVHRMWNTLGYFKCFHKYVPAQVQDLSQYPSLLLSVVASTSIVTTYIEIDLTQNEQHIHPSKNDVQYKFRFNALLARKYICVCFHSMCWFIFKLWAVMKIIQLENVDRIYVFYFVGYLEFYFRIGLFFSQPKISHPFWFATNFFYSFIFFPHTVYPIELVRI